MVKGVGNIKASTMSWVCLLNNGAVLMLDSWSLQQDFVDRADLFAIESVVPTKHPPQIKNAVCCCD
jgi:hypothetical protein